MKSVATLPRQMLFYGLGIVLMKGVSLVMLPIITRYLPPSDYGLLDVLLTWMNVLGIVLGFGMAEVLYRYCPDANSAQQVYRYLLKLHLLLVAPLLVATCVAIFILSAWLPDRLTPQLLLTAIIASGAATLATLPLCWLRMQDQAEWFFYCTAGKALLQAGLCWVFLDNGFSIAGVLYASVISQLILLLMLWHKQPAVDTSSTSVNFAKPWRLYLNYGFPLVLSGLCLFLVCGAERWIVAAVLSTHDVALYAVASQFAMMVAVSIEPFTLWWYPNRLKMLHQANGLQRVACSAGLGCILSVASALVIGNVGPLVIAFLLPESYGAAAQLLPTLCLAMALKQCSHLLNTGCYTGNSTRAVGHINAALASIAPVFYVIGCWLGQLDGLLVALVMIYSLRLFWFLHVSQRMLLLPYPKQHLICCIGSAALLLAVMPYMSVVPTSIITMLLLASFSVVLLKLSRFVSNNVPQQVLS